MIAPTGTNQSRQRGVVTPRRWVIKLGSALLTDDGRGLYLQGIADWVGQMAELRKRGIDVVLVSSGAVAAGMQRLGWRQRPRAVYQLQAAAAVGQMGLVQAYESCFQHHGLHTAQILLTHDDLSHRQRYLNARSTLWELIRIGVVPVVNENDTVVTDEIRFGDNDTLAALVTNLVEAERLILLTDQAGLYDRDPRVHPDAQLVREARAGDPALRRMVGHRAGELGKGGMLTKLRAAALAARSGAATIIAGGREPDILGRLAGGAAAGTLLLPSEERFAARKRWLAGHLQLRGQLVLDDGAAKVLREKGRSLLAVGVVAVRGDFVRGEMVACFDQAGTEVARGLANYSAAETARILGHPSEQIEGILGYVDEPELIHRDNLVVV